MKHAINAPFQNIIIFSSKKKIKVNITASIIKTFDYKITSIFSILNFEKFCVVIFVFITIKFSIYN